jgi:hypothetical protein
MGLLRWIFTNNSDTPTMEHRRQDQYYGPIPREKKEWTYSEGSNRWFDEYRRNTGA